MTTKHLKGECQHCRGHLSFPAEATGEVATCPHCGKETELLLAVPKSAPSIPARSIVYLVIAVLILGGGVAALMIRLKHQQQIVAEKKRTQNNLADSTAKPTEPTPVELAARAGFRVSPIKLEKTQGTSLVHATGTVKNETGRKCFGVKIELDVLNNDGEKIGTAIDQISTFEPKAEWRFNALVFATKAASAKLSSIKEDQ
jgi:hypothetical protein